MKEYTEWFLNLYSKTKLYLSSVFSVVSFKARAMKRLLFKIIILNLLSIFLFSFPCLADFRFVVMGDSRGNDDGINTEVLGQIMDRIESEEVDFIVFVGDLITGSKSAHIHRKRLLKWKSLMDGYRIPVYIAIGNHEIEDEGSEDMLRSIFEMPENGPSRLKELVYSFDYENAHFVILDTDIYKEFHRLGKTQLEWLEKDLTSNKKDRVFVFGHEPAYPVGSHKDSSLDAFPSERDEAWSIFQENGVDMYFCGHEHLYNRSIKQGICQVITGGAGARLCAFSKDGRFYHFVIVDVKDNGECEVVVKDNNGMIRDN